ncbi:MAG: Glutathione-regulated potassium-efflux system ancillary protein KefF [Candidatus Celerinatantimonas neptuna]|nr:MAG: Glutathione-regulated potassium-efflux system ancillary protein KefF [Candidatus Celerinatantimonas neptuna]
MCPTTGVHFCFSMPAILKGWIDRVYAYGFAYDVGEYTDKRWSDRYGEGIFAGKKAMLVVSTGGQASNFSPRGVHGPIDDILFPIQHGMLFYPGFEVLPPFVIHHTHRIDEARYQNIYQSFAQRLNTLKQTAPIQYRPQNAGDYRIPELTLREEILPGQQGLSIHIKQ